MTDNLVSLSPLDEARFGIRTARAAAMTSAALPDVIAFCQRERVRLLIARCPAAELSVAQAMEARGFYLTDTLVYWGRELGTPIPDAASELLARPIGPGESSAVAQVAADAFRGYFGHYHADPRLDRQACDDTYASWAQRSCTDRRVAEDVLVVEDGARILGFASLRRNAPEEAEIVLNGVSPAARRRGVYRALVIEAMRWSRARNCSTLIISTQLTNLVVQKAWARLGFTPQSAYYTFHKWFD